MQEEIEKYKGQVKQYDAGRPNTAAPQPSPAFKGGEVVGSPESDAASRAVGAVGRGISKVGESMAGTSGGVVMRGPELRGNMPNSAQLQDKPFNYQQQPGMGQIARGAIDTMAKTSGAISTPGAEQPFVNSMRRPIGDTVRTFDPSAVENRSSMPGMLEGLNVAIGDVGKGLVNAGGKAVSTIGKFGEDMTEGRLLGSAASPSKEGGTVGEAQAATTTPTSPVVNKLQMPVSDNVMTADGIKPVNSFQGNFAADNAQGQGIFKDPTTGRVSIKLTGDEGSKFMNERIPTARPGMTLSATEAKTDKPAQRPMGEYGGMYAQASPATPVAQAATAAPAMTGNPLVDQKNMEAALQRKQMEVMAAERADKSLMQAPGSRDYISPTLTEEQQRARQVEISAQRRQDMRDARDNTVAQMEARDAALAYRSVPSDATRNQSMAPYAARRTDINSRDAMLTRAQEQEKTGATVADNEATRAVDMQKAQLKGDTDRYTADKNAELAQSTVEANAASKVLDRQTTMEAARLKIDNTKDPIMLKKVDGYNEWLESVMAMGQQPTEAQLTDARKLYGVESLFAPSDPYAKVTIPAPSQK